MLPSASPWTSSGVLSLRVAAWLGEGDDGRAHTPAAPAAAAGPGAAPTPANAGALRRQPPARPASGAPAAGAPAEDGVPVGEAAPLLNNRHVGARILGKGLGVVQVHRERPGERIEGRAVSRVARLGPARW